MRTFDEIESKEARLSVQTIGKPEGSGMLTLDREQTSLSLSTNELFYPKTDINGWFDIRLRHGSRAILLLNSLFQSQTDHGNKREMWETGIFPNIVVFNADALDKNDKVRTVLFRIEKFADFFVHHVIEHQSLYEAKQDVFRSLKKLRNNKFSKQYPVRYDFHKPDSVYLVHLPPRVLSFKALGNKFEMHWGMSSRGFGWDGIQVKAEPIGKITFAESKSIDEAIDEIWIWKRLFCQLAMERLDLTTISSRSTTKRLFADIYLSNAKRKSQKESDPWSFRRGESPYSQWSERKKLGETMQAWLSKNQARNRFRVNVDRVIANLRKSVDLEDIVTLCAAVESLDELKSSKGLADKDIKKIAKAAAQAALDEKIPVDPARIHSVIGMLKHHSLPQRLKLLMAALAPAVTPAQAKTIISGAVSLRVIAAHGGSIASLSIPRVQPIVTALAGACVAYDLLTSGFPPKANEHTRLRAMRQIKDSVDWLSHLEKQTARLQPKV